MTIILPVVAALGTLGACVGFGSAAARKMGLASDEPTLAWLQSTVLGLGLLGMLAWPFAALGLLDTAATPLLALGLGLFLWQHKALTLPSRSTVELCLLVLVGVPALRDVFGPATDTDEIYYQLALPGQLLREGMQGGWMQPNGSRPQILHLVDALAMSVGGDAGLRLLHLLLALGLLVGLRQLGTRLGNIHVGLVAAAAVATSWSFAAGAGLGGTDVPAALAVLAALDAALRRRTLAFGLAAGVALSIKYTTAGPLLGVGLASPLLWRERGKAAAIATLIVAPWWLRNLGAELHPLFPFSGWGSSFQYVDKYGAGRDAIDFLWLPWRVVFDSSLSSMRFLGRLSPAFLILGLGAISGCLHAQHRKLVLGAAVAAAAWALGPQWLRYLIPALPLLALAGALPLARGGRWAWALVWLAILGGLPANNIQLFTENESPKLHDQEIVAWAQAHLPDDAKVALFFNWSVHLLKRATVLGSVEDHIPTRHWIQAHGNNSLTALTREGVTHVLYTQTRFWDKTHPFLDEETIEQELNDPVQVMGNLLLMEATLIHQRGRTGLWRLPPANPDP